MPTRAQIADAARGSRRELTVAAIVFVWIALGAGTDSGAGIWRQRLVGVMTWALLVALLRKERRLVRIQVVGVILVATCVEYTASPFLGYYTYRLHNVPSYVPPGHGLVYLAALSIGCSQMAIVLRRPFIVFTLVVCGAWAAWGVFLSPREDVFGAIMFLFLLWFTLRGSRPLVYAGAFLVTSYLELIGRGWGPGHGRTTTRPACSASATRPAASPAGIASSTPRASRWGRASGRSSSAGRWRGRGCGCGRSPMKPAELDGCSRSRTRSRASSGACTGPRRSSRRWRATRTSSRRLPASARR